MPGAIDKLLTAIRAIDHMRQQPFTTLGLTALCGLVEPAEQIEQDDFSGELWCQYIGNNAVPPMAFQSVADVMGRACELA